MLLLRRPGRAGAFVAAPVLSCLVLFVAPSKSAAMSPSVSISASRCASGDLWRFVPTASCPRFVPTASCPLPDVLALLSERSAARSRSVRERHAPTAPHFQRQLHRMTCASSYLPHSSRNHVWRRHLHVGTSRPRHRAVMLKEIIGKILFQKTKSTRSIPFLAV
jgi:hypothetical protein